jgi:hypothetical protein
MSLISLEIGSMVFQRKILFKLDWVYALWSWQYGILGTILCLTNQKKLFPTGYPHGYPLDSYVVLSPTRGAAGSDGFWVQPFGDSSSSFIQPVRLAITSSDLPLDESSLYYLSLANSCGHVRRPMMYKNLIPM